MTSSTHPHDHSEHRLAAIMFTDIVGYTTLMGESEEKAIKLLDQNRKLQKDQIEKFNGKFLKEMGDGILASFDSASRAVYCAGAIQIAAKQQGIDLRIGIHLGDVVFSNGDVFGDGVNIASRIEQLAETGGIAITGSVYGNIKNKEGIRTEFIKEESLKNVEEPVKIYKAFVDEIPNIPLRSPINKNKATRGKKRSLILFAGIAVVTIGFLFWYFASESQSGSSGFGDRLSSIAVLPFEDLSPEQDQEYLGDGLAEEIINVLTTIDSLKVIGRTSSFSFKGQNDDLVAIGSKLGVGALLEGSVRKSNNRIRVTAQLIDASDGSHVWSDTYERELEDIFAIQDEIAGIIADKFQLTLTLSREDSPPTRNIDAYEMYLRGKQYYDKGIIGAQEGIAYLEKAMELDPNFLAANSTLVEGYWVLGLYGLMDHGEANKLAKDKALEIIRNHPDSYEGYSQLSWVNFAIDWDWEAVEMNYEKAIELGLPLPDQNYTYYQAAVLGLEEEPIQSLKKLLEDDPLSVDLLLDLSRMYLYNNRYQDVIDNSRKIFELSPENTSVRRHVGSASLFSGDYANALKYYGELLERDSTYAPYGYVGALVGSGKEDEARTLVKILPFSSSAKKAMCYIHLDEMDSVFKYLDIAYKERDAFVPFLKAEPHFTLIENEPRYKELLVKMKFPEN